jgi:DNA repair protein RadA/Sms
MAKTESPYRCDECGWTTLKWVGRCGECQSWGTVIEVGAPTSASRQAVAVVPSAERIAKPITEHSGNESGHVPTGVGEFDRVLGGGIVPGAVILLSGEPGVGKSTLLLDVAAKAAQGGKKVLYVSAEESAGQVYLRASRTNGLDDNLFLANETDLGGVLGHIDQVQPELMIVDSIQTVSSGVLESSAGGVAQVREVAATLIRVAKNSHLPIILVGHVTKDGQVAGPRTLEHLG